jgi:hypothetical protein
MPTPYQPAIGARTKSTIEIDGLTFRDLDADGQLTPDEDWRLPAAERAADRNAVVPAGEEKQGADDHVFIAGSSVNPTQAATFLNAVQERAEGSRPGIPALFKSNARNHIDPACWSTRATAPPAHRQSAAPQLFTPVERAAHLGSMAAMPMSADAAASSAS